jgi:2-oxoglutarate ferredoxin oxidoreductase subunit delta
MAQAKKSIAGKISIDGALCKGCGLCVWACPKGVIARGGVPNAGGVFPAVAGGEGCIACGMCFAVCPDCCITVYKRVAA